VVLDQIRPPVGVPTMLGRVDSYAVQSSAAENPIVGPWNVGSVPRAEMVAAWLTPAIASKKAAVTTTVAATRDISFRKLGRRRSAKFNRGIIMMASPRGCGLLVERRSATVYLSSPPTLHPVGTRLSIPISWSLTLSTRVGARRSVEQ